MNNLIKNEIENNINSQKSQKNIQDYKENIGKKVTKCRIIAGFEYTPKPFKSTFKINTVKDVIIHPILNIPAYTFIEDDSYVECRRCKVVE